MLTVSLTVREYNDALVRAALAVHWASAAARYETPQNGGADEGARRGIAGRPDEPLANPPKSRRFDTGFVTSPTGEMTRRGGRPRRYRDSAARQRSYRARRSSRLTERVHE